MAVAAGNSINIPLMRRTELTDGRELNGLQYRNHQLQLHQLCLSGIMLESAEGEKIGESKIAARQGISMVVLSRVGMATPGMVSTLLGASRPSFVIYHLR